MTLSNKEMIEIAVTKMAAQYPNEDKEKYITLLSDIFEKGVYPKDAMGFSDEFIEMIYAYAYKLFQSGKFEQAATAYKFLITACPFDLRHRMALATCFHKMHDYTSAITMYTMVSLLTTDDPMPCYYASDCFLKLNAIPDAIEMLTQVVNMTANNPKYAPLRERAQLTLQSLQKPS